MPPAARELTQDLIIATTERLLRRFGPEKLRLVDVARELGMSHANIYRFFPDKQAVLDAVAERWLHRVCEPLVRIVNKSGPAAERLEDWTLALTRAKHRKAKDDPEMFRTYHEVAQNARAVVARHVQELVGQLAEIIGQGNRTGEWRVADPAAAGELVLHATMAYHHPALVHHVETVRAEQGVRALTRLLVAGFQHGAAG